MSSILLKSVTAKGKCPTGSSKIFGNPDVWAGFTWPCVHVDGEACELSFMCQINCADAAKYDIMGLLPKTGMLYFFYDLDGMPWQPCNTNAAKVLYYDGDIGALREMVLTDENGEGVAFNEQKIDFELVEAGYLSESLPTHLLLGIPSLECEIDACIRDFQMLLQLDSFETEDASINFTDEGVLCFFIDRQKLNNHDFSDIRIKQIYS